MKSLVLTTLITATVTAASSFLLAQAQEKPRVAPKLAPPQQQILPVFLQDEEVELPVNPRTKTRTFTNFDTMHDAYFDDFAKKPGFGASRIMYLPPRDYFTLNGETYRFAAPDLLGLEDEPVGYQRPWGANITAAVMSKKESRAALKHRTLTSAELSAVAELREGKNLVTMTQPLALVGKHGTNYVTGVLAVGALRAKAQCAACHQVKEGTLLGAFSYTLVPTNTVAPSVLATTTRSR